MIQVERLDNKIKVLMETVSTTETVSIGFWFTHGSRDEVAVHGGYTHFLEHMLFKGTNKRSAFQIAKEIDRVGGGINAFTEKEFTCFYSTVPGSHLLLAIDIITDMIFNSLLDDKEVEKEKIVIINEIQAVLDSPEEVAHELFFEKLWKNHPLSRKIAGELGDIKKVDRERLHSFYRDVFLQSELLISIAGKFDPRMVTGHLNKVITYKPTGKRELSPPLAHRFTHFKRDKFNQVQIYTGLDLPEFNDLHDFYKILIFSTIIGESMSSRLFQKVREEKGLCYSIYSFRNFFIDTSLWLIYSSTSTDFVLPLLESINGELGDLNKSSISAAELADAKTHLQGNLLLSKEDMETRMKRLARLYFFTGLPLEYEQSISMIGEISLDELNETVRHILDSSRFSLMTYGNKEKIKWKGFKFNF